MVDIPHFASPFTLVGTSFGVVDQDSDEDILQCVETVLRTPAGSRDEVPEFGMDDPTFTTDPSQVEADALAAIREWEPRATAIAEAEILDRIATLGVTVA